MARLTLRVCQGDSAIPLAGTILAFVLGGVTPAAADPHSGRGSGGDAAGALPADVAHLDRGLRDLQTGVRDLERREQEHFEQLRRLLVDKKGPTAAPATAATATGGAAPSEIPGTGTTTSPSMTPATAVPTPAPRPMILASVSGRVNVKGPLHDVYVYLEGFRSTAGRRAQLEIVQRNKAFEPSFAVALAGTHATFPNRDTFFHNVFSPNPAPFDLGTYRADESSPSVLLGTPGVVEVYCNIHAQMHAQILVVPNRVFARVADDGTFHLDHVPVGHRRLVAWGPDQRAARLEVTVPVGGARVNFDLQPEVGVRHTNKFGLPYGAYHD